MDLRTIARRLLVGRRGETSASREDGAADRLAADSPTAPVDS